MDMGEGATMEHEVLGRIQPMAAGVRVEIRDRFQGGWASGFEVFEYRYEGVRVRRISDGVVLPYLFGPNEIRPSLP